MAIDLIHYFFGGEKLVYVNFDFIIFFIDGGFD